MVLRQLQGQLRSTIWATRAQTDLRSASSYFHLLFPILEQTFRQINFHVNTSIKSIISLSLNSESPKMFEVSSFYVMRHFHRFNQIKAVGFFFFSPLPPLLPYFAIRCPLFWILNRPPLTSLYSSPAISTTHGPDSLADIKTFSVWKR